MPAAIPVVKGNLTLALQQLKHEPGRAEAIRRRYFSSRGEKRNWVRRRARQAERRRLTAVRSAPR